MASRTKQGDQFNEGMSQRRTRPGHRRPHKTTAAKKIILTHFPTSFIHIPHARIGRFTLVTRNKRRHLFSGKALVMHLVFLNLAKTLASPKISGILIAIASKSIMNSAVHALANRCPAQRQANVRAIAMFIHCASATAMPVGSEASRT